jgi:hypothetical protein
MTKQNLILLIAAVFWATMLIPFVLGPILWILFP